MRSTTLLFSLLVASPALAQANDWAGIMMRCDGVTPPVNSVRNITCGNPMTCQPLMLNGAPGDTIQFFVMGTFNGFYALAASLDVGNLGCIPLAFPGLVNDLVLSPASVINVSAGLCTVPDNGRCNGGSTPLTMLLTIPPTIPSGQIAFQAIVSAPLSAGGVGLAFTDAVLLTF